jgi:hypothetical protein
MDHAAEVAAGLVTGGCRATVASGGAADQLIQVLCCNRTVFATRQQKQDRVSLPPRSYGPGRLIGRLRTQGLGNQIPRGTPSIFRIFLLYGPSNFTSLTLTLPATYFGMEETVLHIQHLPWIRRHAPYHVLCTTHAKSNLPSVTPQRTANLSSYKARKEIPHKTSTINFLLLKLFIFTRSFTNRNLL